MPRCSGCASTAMNRLRVSARLTRITIARTATTAPTATKGIEERTGDGRTSSIAIASTTCTTCPAARSHQTALRPTSDVLHVAAVT